MKSLIVILYTYIYSTQATILKKDLQDFPSFYDKASNHNGERGSLIPARFKEPWSSDRAMHHLIKYYGTQDLGKCNKDKKASEGESVDDWKKPINFLGEFPNCGKPFGPVFLNKNNAIKAARETVENYYQFKGSKLDEFIKENVL